MIQVKHIKKVTSFLLILVTALLLVACSKKENVPYGSIDNNKEYLSLGSELKITEKEVYDTLRKQAAYTLPALIEEQLFAHYEDDAKELLKKVNDDEDSVEYWAQEEFDSVVNKNIFQTTDVDNLKSMTELRLDIAIAKYVDSIYSTKIVVDSKLTKSAITNKVKAFVSDSESDNFAKGYFLDDLFIELYLIDIQKLLFAKDELAKDVEDEDSSNYVEEKNIVSYYKNNIKTKHDVNAFFFPFISTNEANEALKRVGIKSNSRGHWFEVPNIRLIETRDRFADSVYFDSVLEKVELVDRFNEDDADNPGYTTVTELDNNKFYDAYSPTEKNSKKMDAEDVLVKFVEAYNLVNSNEVKVVTDGDDVSIEYTKRDDKFKTEYDYDEITDVSSTLRNYIYNTLTEEKPYSTLRSIGNYRYLVFKLDEDYLEIDYVSETKDEDDNEKFITGEELDELLAEQLEDLGEEKRDQSKILKTLKVINEETKVLNSDDTVDTEAFDKYLADLVEEWREALIDSKLTSSYANSKVNDLYNKDDASINIYDNIVRLFYNQNSKLEAKGKSKTGNVLLDAKFKVGDKDVEVEILVDDYFKELSVSSGLEVGLDLLLNKHLLKLYKDKDDMFKDEKINEKDFKKELKDMIRAFSNDQLAQAGYPSEMGRETFLLLLFGTTDIDKAIELGYLAPKLKEIFIDNEELHYGDSELNKTFAEFAKHQYDHFKGVNVSHLLVFFDEDGSGTPDNPRDYLDKIGERGSDERNEVLNKVIETLNEVMFQLGEIGNDDLEPKSFNDVIDKFQAATRLPINRYNSENYNKYLEEYAWAHDLRKYGINLKFEDLGQEITNTSNLTPSLDPVFYDRAIALRDMVEAVKGDRDSYEDVLPYLDFGFKKNTVNESEVIEALDGGEDVFTELTIDIIEDYLMSDFGIHFIKIDTVSEKASAKYSSSKDSEGKYKDKDNEDLNAYNEDEDYLLESQIEYYLENYDTKGVYLPSAVEKAINSYFSPVYKLFTSQNTKMHLVYKYLLDNNVNLGDHEAKFYDLVERNESQLHDYLNGRHPNYDELYEDFYAKLNIEISK